MAKYESLKDHVYAYITKKIQNGELLPNQKVSEVEICTDLEISRTPAREALIQLSADNLIEYIPRKGFIVKEIDTKKKTDVYKIIGALDALAASLALNTLTEQDFNKMDEIAEKIDIAIKYKNYPDYFRLQTEFHDVYIDKCNNSSLTELLFSLKNSFIRLAYLSHDKEKLFNVLGNVNLEHKNIARLLREKKIDELENAIKLHWDSTHEDMI